MKITVQIKAGNSLITAEGEDIREIHKALSKAAEVYGEPCCGNCGKNTIIPNHRVSGKFDYYELRCTTCNYRLALGQSNNKTLYPKRKMGSNGLPVKTDDPKGTYDKKHKGWHLFTGNENDDEEEITQVTRRK